MEHGIVLIVIALIAVAATNLLAARLPIAPPIVQTLAGIGLAFVPGLPPVSLDPQFVLLGVLPPLVYASAVDLPWKDFSSNLRPILTLAFGLVAATIAAVAVVAHALVPGLPWAAAIVLGAIVSPTDPVASTTVASQIGVPRRLVAIIEGEGLVNDAVALTIKAIALSALLGGGLSISTGVLRFAAIVAGEILYGCAVAWAIAAVRRRIEDSSTETMVSLVTPFVAYLVPEALGGSGVLATVAAAMYIGVQRSELVPPGTRLHLTPVWEVIVFALNGTLFLLMGLQWRSIMIETRAAPGHLLLWGIAIALTAIAVRFCWTWPAAWLPRAFSGGLRQHDPMPSSRHLGFIAWSGMRGSISLAAALSIPVSVRSRMLITFITACVIAATLLVQGTTLPWIIRFLRLDEDAARERDRDKEAEAKARASSAAAAVKALENEKDDFAVEVRQSYEAIARGQTSRDEADNGSRVERKAIAAERRCVIDMHRKGEISDYVLRRMERDLDLRQSLLENRLSG